MSETATPTPEEPTERWCWTADVEEPRWQIGGATREAAVLAALDDDYSPLGAFYVAPSRRANALDVAAWAMGEDNGEALKVGEWFVDETAVERFTPSQRKLMLRKWYAGFDGDQKVTKWRLDRARVWGEVRALQKSMPAATRKGRKFSIVTRRFLEARQEGEV